MSELSGLSQERLDSVLNFFNNQKVIQERSDVDNKAEFSIAAECVSVTVNNGKICVNLPFGLGETCIDVPDWVPDGEAAKACISIEYKKVWGVKIPVAVKVCVIALDIEIACAKYGL